MTVLSAWPLWVYGEMRRTAQAVVVGGRRLFCTDVNHVWRDFAGAKRGFNNDKP